MSPKEEDVEKLFFVIPYFELKSLKVPSPLFIYSKLGAKVFFFLMDQPRKQLSL